VARAAAILTPSEFSRNAILRHYRVDPEKVHVIPNAVSAEFRPIERQTAQAALQRKFGLSGPFVLMVGDLQPRKNHLGLLRAFEQLVDQHPQLPHHLIFVGKETWYADEVRRAIARSSVKGRVHLTGFVHDSDLVQFYGASDLFVFPSFYEGFGLPILEAMACGRAVACSNTTAMPEVAEAAGILFDPSSEREMARAMADVLLNQDLRQRLERLGTNRAALFSWEHSALMTLDVYSSIVGGRSNLKNVVRAGA
jgi:glycosyltransferase involved in cell wall biosynthesis